MRPTASLLEGLAFVLVHSPIVGPDTWEPVAQVLRSRQAHVVVPELVDDGSPPFWRQHARCVVRRIAEDVEPGLQLVLVAHSGAGQLLGVLGPVLRDAGYQVAAHILADAGLPPEGLSRLEQLERETPQFADELRALFEDGQRFPVWSDEALAPLVPDAERRAQLLGGVRQLPPPYWEEQIPTALDWPDAPVGALIFSASYDATVRAAREQQWPVRIIDDDNHFVALADEERVADELLALTQILLTPEGDDSGVTRIIDGPVS